MNYLQNNTSIKHLTLSILIHYIFPLIFYTFAP